MDALRFRAVLRDYRTNAAASTSLRTQLSQKSLRSHLFETSGQTKEGWSRCDNRKRISCMYRNGRGLRLDFAHDRLLPKVNFVAYAEFHSTKCKKRRFTFGAGFDDNQKRGVILNHSPSQTEQVAARCLTCVLSSPRLRSLCIKRIRWKNIHHTSQNEAETYGT
jgi:hypothetical protein